MPDILYSAAISRKLADRDGQKPFWRDKTASHPVRAFKTNARNAAFCIFAGGTLSIFPDYFFSQSEWYQDFYARHVPFAGQAARVYFYILGLSAISLLVWTLRFHRDEPLL